jgi:excisionase family DNA binding protein
VGRVVTALVGSEFYSVTQVAAFLDVSESSVRRLIRDGRLPACRTPRGRWQIAGVSLETLLEPVIAGLVGGDLVALEHEEEL